MKRIFSLLAVMILLSGTWGCQDWLNIKPESEVVLEDFWQNESQVNQALAACYRSLTEQSVMERMLVWGELRSDDVTFGSDMPVDMNKMLNVDISPSNGYCQWGSLYTVINYCNNFLHFAPQVVDIDANFTESKLHTLEAEVLTIRALAYFYLVRTFKEVPWIDQPSIDDAQDYNIPKSPEDVVLDNIEADLTTALKYARTSYQKNVYDKGRITRNAVRALLADIYLWRENYQQCVGMCNQILDNPGNLELVDGKDVLRQVFYQGNSTESIFELQFDDDNQFNQILHDYYGYTGNLNGEWSFPGILITGQYRIFNIKGAGPIESENDIRQKDFLRSEIGGDKYYVFKYAGALREENTTTKASTYYYRSTTANWIVYRLPDIILMKAEALIQLGTDNEEAMRMINMTYLRSNFEEGTEPLKLENYNTKGDLEKLLLRERQRELMFEGKRWFDLMRLARRADSPTPLLNYVIKKFTGNSSLEITKMSVMDALYLPIHTDELKANTALEQNPFYETTGDNALTQ
ncbi:MAG TPA: RagB/SusD family nutrient uptake outer membrane protein [Bacteroidales bacterium]|nr:RagB/SusD family nutrient uptake outer membrane protein [Bacteroidales bacterium]